jgi:uncharacterized membrane protein
MIVNSIQEVFAKESKDLLAAINVHQHDSICIEKASEYMAGQSKEQKGRHRHHTYLITRNDG